MSTVLKKLKVLKFNWERDLKFEEMREEDCYDEHSDGTAYPITPVSLVTEEGARLGDNAIPVPAYYTFKMLKAGQLFTIQDPFNGAYYTVGNYAYYPGIGPDFDVNPLDKHGLAGLKKWLKDCQVEKVR